MKNLTFFVLALILGVAALAQTPQSFRYQAVARDNSGIVLANQPVSLRISILSGSVSGAVAYSETHAGLSTNAYGLVELEIGKGTPGTGSFSAINWGNNLYFVKVEMDPAGGSAFQVLSTSQLLSVPYALHAKTVETGDNWGNQAVATDATLGGNGTVTTPLKIADGGVTSAKITDGTIVNADLADMAISSSKIQDGSITTSDLAGDIITTWKIVDGTITANDIGSNTITTDKIVNGAVTANKIAQAGATNGQALKWSGTTWAPADDAIGTGLILPYDGSITTGGISFKITCNGGQGLTSKGWGIGLLGEAESTQGTGVLGKGFVGTSGNSEIIGGKGVSGSATSVSGINSGVYGYASSPDGYGVNGYNSAITGNSSGVFGESRSSSGKGVYGLETSSSGTTFGVLGESKSPDGIGVYGLVTSTTGACYGIRGQSNSSAGFGVVGHANSATGITYGVKGQSMSPDGYGVHGLNYATSGLAIGVYGDTQSGTGIGVYGSTASTGNGKAIYGLSNSTGYAGYFLGGQVYIDTKLGIGKGANYTLDVVGTANLLNGIPSGIALRCNGDEAIWYNGTYFSWGFDATFNYFKDAVGIDCFPGDGHLLAVNGVASKPGGGLWTAFSDIRLKDIHGKYTRGLSDILQLQPVIFSYKTGNELKLPSKPEYVGFIAQDVQKVFPETVTENKNGYLEFDMQGVNVAVINAIKELKAENDRLKLDNEQLNTRLKKIEALIDYKAEK